MAVPAFIARAVEKKTSFTGQLALEEMFEIDKVFSWKCCQTFPIKFWKSGQRN